MRLYATCVVLVLLAGVITTDAQRDYRDQSLALLRLLDRKPWSRGPRSSMDQTLRININPQQPAEDDEEALRDDLDDGLSMRSSKRSALETIMNAGGRRRQPTTPPLGVITTDAQRDDRDQSLNMLQLLATKPWSHRPRSRVDQTLRIHMNPEQPAEDDEAALRNDFDDGLSMRSSKRSALATVLNAGRRRRQPTTPPLGVLNDVGTFFNSLQENLDSLVLLSPAQRAALFQDPPTVVHADSSGGDGSGSSGGGIGMRRLHALRPLRPTGNIRSYNRRSFLETDGVYPRANHHDPGLLWTGLGR